MSTTFYKILKLYEAEVKEIVDENSKLKFCDPLVLVSKTTGKDVCFDYEANENEGLLMNSDDEVVAYIHIIRSINLIRIQLVLLNRVSKKWKRRKKKRNLRRS